MSGNGNPPLTAAELRATAEAASQHASARAAGLPAEPETAQALLHDLHVHQIELEMQNEELRRAQAETQTWRDHYSDLYELAPVGYCSLSQTGRVLQANLTLAGLLGVVRGTLIGLPLSRFIAAPGQDDFHRLCIALLPEPEADAAQAAWTRDAPRAKAAPQMPDAAAHSIELQVRHSDGRSFWAQLVARVLPDGDSIRPGGGTNRGLAERPALGLVISDISARKQDQLALQTALTEQQALLKEVHHRVKNNLQVISSLLRLEARRSDQPDTRAVLGDMQGRIRAMAQLHDSLYRSGVFATVDLAAYLTGLATQAVRALGRSPCTVRLQLGLAALTVTMDQAMPLGLLANELVSNAFKHGFADDRSGDLKITLAPVPASARWQLCVSDTGVGLPADFAARRGQSLGLQLANSLAEQAGGVLAIGPGPLAVFTVDFTPAAPAPGPSTPWP